MESDTNVLMRDFVRLSVLPATRASSDPSAVVNPPKRPIIINTGAITKLPQELVEQIVFELRNEPCHIAALAQTCRQQRTFIYHPVDTFLWRNIYLTKYDDPRTLDSRHRLRQINEYDWAYHYRERIWAATYLQKLPMEDVTDDPSEAPSNSDEDQSSNEPRQDAVPPAAPSPPDDPCHLRALTTLLSIIDTLPPLPSFNTSLTRKDHCDHWRSMSFGRAHIETSKDPLYTSDLELPSPSLDAIAYHESLAHGLSVDLLQRLNTYPKDSAWDQSSLGQALYKLIAHHVLLSGTARTYWEPLTFETPSVPSTVLHKWAYNLRLLKRSHMYGPFIPLVPPAAEDTDPDDQFQFGADWSMLAAIAMLMRIILVSVDDTWMASSTLGADALRPGPWIPVHDPLDGPETSDRDWAGVEGVWRRLETWLALNVLQSLNGPDWNDDSMGSGLFHRARHLVPCRLRIVSYSREPGCFPDYPTIHFEGDTGMENWVDYTDEEDISDDMVCHVDGQVSMLADGSVRWSFHMYHSRDKNSGRQWSFEGVQIGGIGSITGIIGVWRGSDTMGFWWQWKVA